MTEMVQVSKADLEVLTRAKGLLDKMWDDPKSGLEFKKEVRKHMPGARIPELDVVEAVTKPIEDRLEKQLTENKALSDRLDSWEKNQQNREEEGALQAQLNDAKKNYGFTDEGMQKLIDRMKAKNNPDVEAAAAWVAREESKNAPVKTSSFAPQKLNLFGSGTEDKQWEALNKDPVAWFDQEVANVMNEFADAA